MDYDPIGMSGFSDGFSYLDNAQSPMDKSFSFINKNTNNMITPQDDSALDKETLKKEAAGRKMEELHTAREKDLPMPQQRK